MGRPLCPVPRTAAIVRAAINAAAAATRTTPGNPVHDSQAPAKITLCKGNLRPILEQWFKACLHGPAMIGQGPFMLSKTDHQHFGQAAFQGSLELGVGFDAVNAYGVVLL